MKHYFNPASRGITTSWMLKELDVACDDIVIDFAAGEGATEEYRAINPMGKVPALEDDGVIVTEVAAICAYLADKYRDKGLAPAIDSPQRGTYYRYLFFSGNTLEPAVTISQNEGADFNATSVGWGDLERCRAAVETMIPENGWALGEQFTTADIVFGGTLDFSMQFGWWSDPSAKQVAYVDRIRARPAYRATHPPEWYE